MTTHECEAVIGIANRSEAARKAALRITNEFEGRGLFATTALVKDAIALRFAIATAADEVAAERAARAERRLREDGYVTCPKCAEWVYADNGYPADDGRDDGVYCSEEHRNEDIPRCTGGCGNPAVKQGWCSGSCARDVAADHHHEALKEHGLSALGAVFACFVSGGALFAVSMGVL